IRGWEMGMELVEGGLKRLGGRWKFMDLGGDMCKMEFGLEYDFWNMVVCRVIWRAFKEVWGRVVDGLVKEGERGYG
ncbi:SRPBCC family protein, partial [Neisseria sicca]|uniref:SRPBCC family protein n=1 Tax=Neisseria sicca TaxID=490 RepID=UPI0034D96A75